MLKEIKSINNEYIKEIAKLKNKKNRDIEKKFLVEGYHLIEMAGDYLDTILITDIKDLNIIKNIEYLAKKTAREVAKTKVEAKLDSMNSYERRIVHSILSEDKYVYTESIGEEPNRCVVIKPKEM